MVLIVILSLKDHFHFCIFFVLISLLQVTDPTALSTDLSTTINPPCTIPAPYAAPPGEALLKLKVRWINQSGFSYLDKII